MKKLGIQLSAIALFMAGAVLGGCASGAKDSAKEGSSTATSTEVSAPDVDLHAAVITNNIAAIKQHIAAGSDLNVKDPFGGSSPLITASLFGNTTAAKLLINAGASVNQTNNEGSTALHTAAFFCRPEIVQLLLDKGADKNVRNNYGSTALESVAGPYKDLEGVYKMMGEQFVPMGLTLDYAYIEKTRPEIANMLKD